MKIIWSDSALVSYEETFAFILENWPIEVAEDLEKSVNELLIKIADNKELCPPSNSNKKIRRCVVSKQTSLIYEAKRGAIHLLLFIDNRSDHSF